jgi:hypothetical protein
VVAGVRFENGQFILDGYPEGATVHGIEGPIPKEFRRLAVFRSELLSGWLSRIPRNLDVNSEERSVFEGLADAALIGFCRCFDSDHPLKPLKSKLIFSPEQRDQLDRLKAVRNKLVGHDEQLTTGVYSLIVRSKEQTAIEAVSLLLTVPFVGLAELVVLRGLSEHAFAWVRTETERIATQIVRDFDALPLEQRKAAPPFTINTEQRDLFAPKRPPRVTK